MSVGRVLPEHEPRRDLDRQLAAWVQRRHLSAGDEFAASAAGGRRLNRGRRPDDVLGQCRLAVWTDQRNTAGAADTTGDNDGADVAGDPETGGSCTSSFTTCFDGTGGLDQNIYSAVITP